MRDQFERRGVSRINRLLFPYFPSRYCRILVLFYDSIYYITYFMSITVFFLPILFFSHLQR
ncbi:hypothetical protein BDA99DRAFT_499434 [Phascolomyces articulosus]|uniref:Uncharacterized protein n=1 Tax=Phascolomyces articulosus TaxID=60185 RepID=A0AAD5KJK8_9FUNG|nr:hypothetical protein BDA99DRAFT_499434 [Phascolomyces articulosus]